MAQPITPIDPAVPQSGEAIEWVEAAADDQVVRTDLQAKLLDFEAANQRLRFENLALRLRLEHRKNRRSFEKKVCAILGAWLFLLLLLICLVRYF